LEGDEILKHVKRPSSPLLTSQENWASDKVERPRGFAKHLGDVFQPHPSESETAEKCTPLQLPETPYQIEPSIKRFKIAEVIKKSLRIVRSHQGS
jgi:hypothetical protein